MTSAKEAILKLVQRLPDTVTWDEVMREIYALRKVTMGESALNKEPTAPPEEFTESAMRGPTQNRSLELQIAAAVQGLLASHGDVELSYITAEFAPFSDQFKPDIVFTPAKGSYADVTHIIELRFKRRGPLALHEVKALPEHREFAVGSLPSARFALATDEELPRPILEVLGGQEVMIFDSIETAESLATAIANWAGLR